jgi:O-antigen/teichoic acid export membrane protein
MNPSQRIVFNTIASYSRSVISVALVLFSSRWVLNALGQIDYGIFSVIGSLIIFIAFLNNVMAYSVGRHYAFAIGQGNHAEVNRWFNAALGIHLCFAVVLTLIGWPVGEYLILYVLDIPANRIWICLGVFRVSLISTFASMISIPFSAMFIAKQHIAELAVWGLLQTILIFILAWFLRYASCDRLMFYAVGMATIIVFIQIAQIIRAFAVFCECNVNWRQWFDKKRLREIFSFASWTLIGSLGLIMRDQGSAIMLNLFFGPKANAAYGIANQVSIQTNQLSASMMGSFSPEITASEGRGDRGRMLDLSLLASKFGTILIIFFAVPLMVEIDYVLKLWLVNPPMHTALFCQLILSAFIIERLSAGHIMAVNAHGKIAAYQAIFGTILISTLPLAWIFLKLGFAPPSIGIAFVITTAICSFGCILWARRLFGMPVKNWVVSVLIPCIIVAVAATLGALIPHWLFQPSFIRLILATSVSMGASLLIAWFIALDSREQAFIAQNARRLLSKINCFKNTR